MSVLNKMTLSTEEYLYDIYNSTRKELSSQINYKNEETQAKQLSAFLTQVKFMQKKFSTTGSTQAVASDNFPFADFWDRAAQLTLINDLISANAEIVTKGTFIQSFDGLANQSQLLGESLEIGVARLIRTFAAKISGESYASTEGRIVSSVGERKTQIPNLNKIVDKAISSIFTDCYNETREKLALYNKKSFNGFQFQAIPAVQGKIDNVGLSANFVMSMRSAMSGPYKDLLLALQDATFTDKNYTTTDYLKLGQTNPFRVFATVAANTGESIPDRYRRMIRCFENHSEHTKGPVYFYRLRAIYELTGAKMQYTKNAINKNPAVAEIAQGRAAKFLIWNNPNSDGVKVIPTAKILDQLNEEALFAMPNNWEDALYGPITLNQKGLFGLE